MGSLSIAPAGPTVSAGQGVKFKATGGSGPGIAWSLATNASGGSIDAGGQYVAGTAGAGTVKDVVQATDSSGAAATATVTVTARGGTATVRGGRQPNQ